MEAEQDRGEGKADRSPVRIDAAGIHVEPVTEVPKRSTNVEIVWIIETKGWSFTERGIEIERGDGSARLAHLLVRRDEHLLGLLRAQTAGAEKRIRAEMERDYEAFVLRGGRQFHSPHNGGTTFRWKDYNDYRELYKYSIEVTNGATTMFLDPAIKEPGLLKGGHGSHQDHPHPLGRPRGEVRRGRAEGAPRRVIGKYAAGGPS